MRDIAPRDICQVDYEFEAAPGEPPLPRDQREMILGYWTLRGRRVYALVSRTTIVPVSAIHPLSRSA